MLPVLNFIGADEGSSYQHGCTVLRANRSSVQPISVPIVIYVPIPVSVYPKLEACEMKMWLTQFVQMTVHFTTICRTD